MRTQLQRPSGAAPLTGPTAPDADAPRAPTAPRREVPLGPSAGAPARAQRPLGAFLAGFLKPVVAAALLATTFTGPALAQGAKLDAPAATEARAIARQVAQKAEVRPALAGALERILARNLGQDRLIDGAGWGDELGHIDGLARAVYDYVDYANPRGDYTLWGAELRGVYAEGGLGVGYTLRPKHRTGLSLLTFEDLQAGVRALDRALDARPPADQGTRDLDTLRAAGWGDSRIHAAAETLLDEVQRLEGAKERRVGQAVALLTHAELLAGLAEGSDAQTLARTVLAGRGWDEVLGRALSDIGARKAAFGTAPFTDATQVDDGVTHYILLLGKRAELARRLEAVRAQL
jgi:hypothetical protein